MSATPLNRTNSRGYYWPSTTIEKTKLSFRESDWNLACGVIPSRTRAGARKPITLPRRSMDETVDSDADSSDDEDDVDEDEEEDEDEDMWVKPPATRVMLEVNALIQCFEKNSVCGYCNGPVNASIKTLCLASSVVLSCKDPDCEYTYHSKRPALAKVSEPIDNRERTTDYAINVLYVLGFVASGDGCTEAARLLGLLGLPNDTTMETRSFSSIEERIGPAIRQLTAEILRDNLTEEVRLTIEASSEHVSNDFYLWQQATKGEVELDAAKYPGVSVSFDMAWQQRNSGNRYASPSGHALLVGKYTRKPISLCIKSKTCNFCKSWIKTKGAGTPVEEHDCRQNHDGSSGSMEPISCLEMVIALHDDLFVNVVQICCDDDASTRSLLKWSNADYMKNNNSSEVPQVQITRGPNQGKLHPRPDKGRLPAHVPEPSFVADPNHRKKVLTGELIALSLSKVAAKATMTRMDATRIGKNFGYMIRSIHLMDPLLYEDAGNAVLEHHFDNHAYCGEWCRRKRQTTAQRIDCNHYYRSKEDKDDAKLYTILQDIVARFVTFDRLAEVAHGMDTQVNESFNNTVSWFAPKNKVYCGTWSLTNRVGLAPGINSVGLEAYFTRLFTLLGIDLTPNVQHFLNVKDRNRQKRLAKIKTRDAKKERMKSKFDKLKLDEVVARKERSKRDGTYRSGQNMMDDIGDDDQQANRQQQKKPRKNVVICPHCGRKGHSTTRSKKCAHYQEQPPVDTTAATGAPRRMEHINGTAEWNADAADDLDDYATVFLKEPTSNPDVGILRSNI
jgi:hypothetical protein